MKIYFLESNGEEAKFSRITSGPDGCVSIYPCSKNARSGSLNEETRQLILKQRNLTVNDLVLVVTENVPPGLGCSAELPGCFQARMV